MAMNGVSLRILAQDVPKLYDFYTEKLGFSVLWGDRSSPYIDFALPGGDVPAFALFAGELMSMHKGYAPLPPAAKSETAVYCIGTDDVDAHCEELKSRGVELLGPSADVPDWGMRCAYFRDPEGNLFEVYGPMTEGPNPYEQA